jgi:hypothetical protein
MSHTIEIPTYSTEFGSCLRRSGDRGGCCTPRLLVIWGKYDLSFDLGEPERYRKDVPNAQVHILNAGHFALDTAADEIAALVQAFVASSRGELQARRAS